MQTMERLSELQIQGFNETQISKETGIQRKMVIQLLNEHRELLRNNQASKDRANDAVDALDQHFAMLIKKAWETITEIEQEIERTRASHQLIAQKLAAVKTLADLEAKRVDALQKAGVLDNNDLGDELAQMEEQRDKIINILRHDLCPQCRMKIGDKLSSITQQSEVVVVYDS